MTKRIVALRLLGTIVSAVSVGVGGLIAFSSGGIERDEDVQSGSQLQQQQQQQVDEEENAIAARPTTTAPVTTSETTYLVVSELERQGETAQELNYIRQKLDDKGLADKYALIDNVEDRAYQILADLGMLNKE